MCDEFYAPTNDWVWLEFKTQDGSTCTTSKDFNKNDQLSTRGNTIKYSWDVMGGCSKIDMTGASLKFRVKTSKARLQAWHNELRLCQIRLGVHPRIFTWTGKTSVEGTGAWNTLSLR